MNITIGTFYWHKRQNMKVWVKSIDRPCIYITEDIDGHLYLAFSDELEEVG